MFTSSTKREIIIKQFHAVVVKRRQGNVQKKRDARVNMLFCLLNLLFFLRRSRCRRVIES